MSATAFQRRRREAAEKATLSPAEKKEEVKETEEIVDNIDGTVESERLPNPKRIHKRLPKSRIQRSSCHGTS